jgi:hypothetical protein
MIHRLGLLLAAIATTWPGASHAAACGSCSECANPRAEDTLICGCFESTPGQVGFSQVLGDSGATVAVPLFIETITSFDTFGVDLDFPAELLRYDSTRVGGLAVDFDVFGANLHPNGHILRVAGWEQGQDDIPAGMTGELAVHYFTIVGVGCGTMCIDALWDGVDETEGYSACTLTDGTSVDDPIEAASWGRVKAFYQ